MLFQVLPRNPGSSAVALSNPGHVSTARSQTLRPIPGHPARSLLTKNRETGTERINIGSPVCNLGRTPKPKVANPDLCQRRRSSDLESPVLTTSQGTKGNESVERRIYIYAVLSRMTEGSMTDHYAAPTNTVLDLLRPKWTKGIALTKVAVILLFLLGISTAGCNQAELTEPNDSLVPTMTPSKTAQTSVAIAISGPTPQINNGKRKNNAEAESNPMSPEEALLMAIKWARWPPVQRFGTLIGNPTDAVGSVMRYEEGYKYYTGDMSNLNLEEKDVVTWAVILEGEFDATCEKPGCGHIKGPWPDWPTKPKDEDWIQTVVLMNAETGELMARGMYHLGRLRSTDGLDDLKHYLPQLPADDPTPYATRPAHDGQPSTLAFPRHNAPLGTDRGEQYTVKSSRNWETGLGRGVSAR